MTSIFQLFKPAPHIEQIQDKNEVDKKYKYWRLRIFYTMLIGYTFFYFTRLSFNFIKPGLIDELHLDKAQVGLLASILYVSYGASKFASGILSDRSNPRYFMAFGLMLTGLSNLFFGLSSSLLFFGLFMAMNGWFQGGGWAPCARLLTHWYSQSERGSWWSSWNISHNIGAFLIPWIVGASMNYYGWRYAMYLPGVICILGGMYLINRLRDTPQSLGLPPVEEYRDDYTCSTVKEGEKEEELTTKEILFDYVLKNKFIWILGLAYFFVYVVRTGIFEWTVLFLIEDKGYSALTAAGCVSLFQIGGALGSLGAGWLSDWFFGARRGPVNVLFALGMFLATFAFWAIPAGYAFLDYAGVFMIGFVTFGPQMLIGLAAAELSHKKAAATSTGFIGCIAYLGAAFAGYPIGKVIDLWGWEGFFVAMTSSSVLAFAALLPLWGVKENKVQKKTTLSSTKKETVAS